MPVPLGRLSCLMACSSLSEENLVEVCGKGLWTDYELPLCLPPPGGLYCLTSPKILVDFFFFFLICLPSSHTLLLVRLSWCMHVGVGSMGWLSLTFRLLGCLAISAMWWVQEKLWFLSDSLSLLKLFPAFVFLNFNLFVLLLTEFYSVNFYIVSWSRTCI